MLKVINSSFCNNSSVVTFREGELHICRAVKLFMLKNSKWLVDFTFPDVIRSTISGTGGSSHKNKFKPKMCSVGQHLVSMWLHMLVARW
jgi:hypothetical protein